MRQAGLALGLLAWAGGAAATDKETLTAARLAYYSLDREGLATFRCRLVPDWEFLLADLLKNDPAAARRSLAGVSGLRFTVDYRVGVGVTIAYDTSAAASEQQEKVYGDIHSSMNMMMTGFFETWSAYVVASPLPDPSLAVKLVERKGQWDLSFSAHNNEIAAIMDKDFVLLSMTATTPAITGVIKPKFTRLPRGYILTAFQAETRGRAPDDTTSAQASISYQDVEGFQLPKDLALSGDTGNDTFQARLAFADCRVTRR